MIAQDALDKAAATNGKVDPYFALGLMGKEGFRDSTINNPMFGNKDNHGYSYGPWQLYSGSPVPGSTAPGGMAAEFTHKIGSRPNPMNWQEQNQFGVDMLSRLGEKGAAKRWYAIRDNGGADAIRHYGHQVANTLGVQPREPVNHIQQALGGSSTSPLSNWFNSRSR